MSDIVKTKKAIADAEARERLNDLAKRAHAMRTAGVKWWDIAEALHISEGQARTLVSERIRGVADLVDYAEKREFMAIELDRLDSLQHALWDEAMEGKVPAVQAILAIMDRRAKWLGFDQPVQQTSITSNTIVVPGNTSEYVAALQAVRLEIEAA